MRQVVSAVLISVLALIAIIAVTAYLTPAPAGSCTSEKGSGVCRPTPQPTCPRGRRCA